MKPNSGVISSYGPKHDSSRSLGGDNTIKSKYPLSRRNFLAVAAGAGVAAGAALTVPRAVSGIASLLSDNEQSPAPPKNHAYEFLDLFQRHKEIYGFRGILGFFPVYSVNTTNWPGIYPTMYAGSVSSRITQPIGLDLRDAKTVTIDTYTEEGNHYRNSSTIEVDVKTGEPIRFSSAGYTNIDFKNLEPGQQEKVRSQTNDALVALIKQINDDANRLVGRETEPAKNPI